VPASLVVVNPLASRARDARTPAALAERLNEVLGERDGAAPRQVETSSAADVQPLVRDALASGVASVVGVGGDGTMREIAASLAGTDVPLGVVPAGTGNQVASVLGIPRSPARALDALRHASVRTIDLGEVTIHSVGGMARTSAFIIGCGAGFDAQLMATTSEAWKRRIGTTAYYVQGARLALHLSTTSCRLTVDGESFEMEATTVLVGNMGQLVPGRLGLRLPLDPADGLLDLIVVGASDPVAAMRGLLDQLRRRGLGRSPAGSHSIRLRGQAVSVEPVAPMPLEVDGDHVGSGGLDARILPGALRVLVPTA
jgi:YegS/Rv2252/BmrU family lipid kinase